MNLISDTDWLALLWRASWQSACIFVFVAAAIAVFRERIAPRWQFILWALVLARMALVVTPSAPWSAFNWTISQSPSPVASQSNQHALPAETAFTPPTATDEPFQPLAQHDQQQTSQALTAPIGPETSPSHKVPENTASSPPTVNYSYVFGAIWGLGFLAASIPLAIAWYRLRRDILRCPSAANSELTRLVAEICDQWNIKRQPRLLVTSKAISPFVVGVFRPCIVLPELAMEQLSRDEIKCIVAHELAHVRRRDVLLQWLTLIVRSVYWFHPCAWLATRQMRLCREAACDDMVTQPLGTTERKQYGLAILRLVQELKPITLAPGFCGLFGAKGSTHYRIARIATGLPTSKLWNIGSMVIIGCVFLAGLTDAEITSELQSDTQVAPPATLPNKLNILGTCKSIKDDAPIPGVDLTLYEVVGSRQEIRKIKQIKSDAAGNYEFADLKPVSQSRVSHRSYVIVAKAKGRADSLIEFTHNFDMLDLAKNLYMAEGTGFVHGEVVDESGAPVKGAIVQRPSHFPAQALGIATAQTDEDGAFVLEGMPLLDGLSRSPRANYVQILHPDFPLTQFDRKPLDDSPFVMARGCIVTGSVLSSVNKQPLSGMAVSAIVADTQFDAREVKAVTDEKGNFRMVLAEGNYNLILEDTKYVAKYQPLECRKGTTLALEPMQAEEGGWIVGQFLNTVTNLPVVSTDVGRGQMERVGVGRFGPDRPMGRLIHTHWLDEVDDQGRFRMLAFPGENYPYLCNIRGSRLTFDTLKQPPVVVEAGKETHYDLTFTPELLPNQKMAKARVVLDRLPKDVDARVSAIITEFRKLNHTVDECEIWCLLMKELVSIGKPAVPALCKELESTKEERMMRRLGFALRGIGDPSAVPAIIRTLPRTLQPPMSDYGLIVEDADLMRFMQKHDISDDNSRNFFDLGRPVRELHAALNTLTKRNIDVKSLASMSKSKDARALAKQEKIYHDAAREWATWWEKNWQSLGVASAYSTVNLPESRTQTPATSTMGLSITTNATVDHALSGEVLTSIGDEDTEGDFFFDLDTGESATWPADLGQSEYSPKAMETAKEWARKRGFDLMCMLHTAADGSQSYALQGIDLELWEIDPSEAKRLESWLKSGKLPAGRRMETQTLLHLDPKSKLETSTVGSSFIYVTKEQGLGVITVTDFVTQARDVSGSISTPKGSGFHRGVRFDYYSIAR